MGAFVGIDLGTTFSAVARINPKTKQAEIIPNEDGDKITPSVVQFLEDGSHICGWEAKEAFEDGAYGCASTFKRNMGTDEVCCYAYGKEYRAEELSAMLLAHLKKQAEDVLGEPVTDAVITVPAYFFDRERMATRRAGEKAGLHVRSIINEPTAAALTYGVGHWRQNALIMVYDLGGGTFDVTLVRMGANYEMVSLCTDGDHRLGGKDWDVALAGLVGEKLYQITGVRADESAELYNEIFRQTEAWKKELSKTKGVVNCKVNVPDFGSVDVDVTREEFDHATLVPLERTMDLCRSVLSRANCTWRDVTDVLLVGGSTRMPQIKEYLTKQLNKAPIQHVNPDEAVALGAAMQTMIASVASDESDGYLVYTPKTEPKKPSLFGKKTAPIPTQNRSPIGEMEVLADISKVKMMDVQGHGMGVVSVNPEGTAYMNENIIPPNQPIPVKSARSFQFRTTSRGPNEVEIFVLEGEGEPLACQFKAKYVATGLRHVKGPTMVHVQYSYDRDAIIHVQVRQDDDTFDLPLREEKIDPAELEKFGRPIDPETLRVQSDLTIVLAVDVSGSMSGEPIEDAKEAMISFVRQYEDTGTRIGIIAVSDRSEWVRRPTDDLDDCIASIQKIYVGMTGACNEAHPFDDFYAELASEDGSRYGIILADGRWENQDVAVRCAKRCNAAGIETAAIGFGYADEKFLNDVSSQKNLSIKTAFSSELKQSFGKIAQSIGTGGGGKSGRSGGNSISEVWEVEAH